MLVLTSRRNQVIRMSGGIEITVLAAFDGRVRLGIVAPEEVQIRRGNAKSGPDIDLSAAPEAAPVESVAEVEPRSIDSGRVTRRSPRRA